MTARSRCRFVVARLTLSGVVSGALVIAQASIAAQPVPGAGQPPLSLETALTLALEQNRSLKAIRLDVDKAEQDIAALRTHRRPNFDVQMLNGTLLAPLNFEFKAGAFGAFPTTGPIPMRDTNVTTDPQFNSILVARVTQPLTQLHRIGLGTRALELQREVAREKVRAQEIALADNVKKLYYGIVQAEAGLTAQEESLRLYRELDRLMAQYVAEQVVLPSEHLSVQAGLARQEQQSLVLRNSIATYREQLNALLGRDLTEPFAIAPPDPVPASGPDLTASETQALSARPDVRIARLQSRQAEFDWRASRAAAIPDISVAFNYVGFYHFEVLPQHAAALGVLASWEPWDWGRKKRESESKRLAIDQSSLAVLETETMARLDVRARFRALEEARDLLRVADLARAPAREKLRVILDRFREEASLQRDVLEAQAALATSDQQYQQATAGFWTARAEFERAMAGN